MALRGTPGALVATLHQRRISPSTGDSDTEAVPIRIGETFKFKLAETTNGGVGNQVENPEECHVHFYTTQTFSGDDTYRSHLYVRSFHPCTTVNGFLVIPENATDGSSSATPLRSGWLLSQNDTVLVGGQVEFKVEYEPHLEVGNQVNLYDQTSQSYVELVSQDFAIISRVLGKGATSLATLAYDWRKNEQVACKLVEWKKPGNGSKIKTVRIRQRLNHPNVSRLRGTYLDWQTWWTFEDLASGGDLEDLINSKTDHITWPDAIQMTRQILQGVKHLHRKGVVHCDIKPSNILCAVGHNKKHRLVITDFDLAVDVSGVAFSEASSRGTPGYISPEMRRRNRFSKPTDLWSVGVTVARLLGKFDGDFSPLEDYPKDSTVPSEEDMAELQGRVYQDYSEAAIEYSRGFFGCVLQELTDSEVPAPADGDDGAIFPGIWAQISLDQGRGYWDEVGIMDRVKSTIQSITKEDPSHPMSHENDWAVYHTVFEILTQNFKEFPSLWHIYVEGILLVHFLRGLCSDDPNQRMTAAQTLEHPWLTLGRGQFFYYSLVGAPRPNHPEELRPTEVEEKDMLKHFWLTLVREELNEWNDTLFGSDVNFARVAKRFRDPSWATLHRDFSTQLDAQTMRELQWCKNQRTPPIMGHFLQ